MSDTLFNMPVCESPRLKWMREHNVSTRFSKNIKVGEEDECSGESLFPWAAFVGEPKFPRPGVGFGNTEHEAIVELSIRKGWKLWNEE